MPPSLDVRLNWMSLIISLSFVRARKHPGATSTTGLGICCNSLQDEGEQHDRTAAGNNHEDEVKIYGKYVISNVERGSKDEIFE